MQQMKENIAKNKKYILRGIIGVLCIVGIFIYTVSAHANYDEPASFTSFWEDSKVIHERLLTAIRTDAEFVDCSDCNLMIDLSNGQHILSDFQDEFMFQYAEDTFVVQNMTFRQKNGKLMSIQIHYVDDISERPAQRTLVSQTIDSIIKQVADIEGKKEKVDAITDIMRNMFTEDRLWVNPHTFDVYGCIGIRYASPFATASLFQACLKRLGYEGSFYFDEAKFRLYNKTLVDDEWKYSLMSEMYAWNTHNSTWKDTMQEVDFGHPDAPLTTEEYTPIAMFANNPYLDETNENAKFFRDQIIAGKSEFILPNEVFLNYHYQTWMWFTRICHEYPEVDVACKSVDTRLENNHLVVFNIQYKGTSAEERTRWIQEYQAARDKIIARANRLESDRAKIIMVNDYIMKTTHYGRLQHPQEAYGCLVERACVCEGYGCAFHDIMNHLGIKDVLLMTNVHLSNRVWLDGEYWLMDVTNNTQNLNLLVQDIPHSQVRTYAPLLLYSLNDTLSMKSEASKYLASQIFAGQTHIDMSALDFWVDEDGQEKDITWYKQWFLYVYPLELLNIDDFSFNIENGKIMSVDVTYKDRNTEALNEFYQYITTLAEEASQLPSKLDRIKYIVKAVYNRGFETNDEEDVLTCFQSNAGSWAARTKICACVFEKLGIRYSIHESSIGTYFKTVSDGDIRYSSCTKGEYARSSVNGWGYNISRDYPIYELFDETYAYQPRQEVYGLECAYLNETGETSQYDNLIVVALGDVDENGLIDSDDAMMVLKYYAGFINIKQINSLNADVNHDNLVDSDDAMLILQYYAGLISEFPAV